MIVKRGNGYGVRVYRGQGRNEWLGTRPTRREARALERRALEAAPTAASVGEFAQSWLSDYEHRVKPSSYGRARHAVNALLRHDL